MCTIVRLKEKNRINMEEFHSKMGHPQFVEKRHTIKKKTDKFCNENEWSRKYF